MSKYAAYKPEMSNGYWHVIDTTTSSNPELALQVCTSYADDAEHQAKRIAELLNAADGPKYRMLEAGEVIERGDEYRWSRNGKCWWKVKNSIGVIVRSCDLGCYRRPLNQEVAK